MTSAGRLLANAPLPLLRVSPKRALPVNQALRSFRTLQASNGVKSAQKSAWKPQRSFTSSARCNISGQEPPSAQAYINSGILAESKKLVDVKKVMVIGSGGLSIGQAGEFDYSGGFNSQWLPS